ncbi:MAG: hypothetical protein J7621_30210 [Niastella sp.]|nr:hypothetical protein [Niastella sp.]
MVITLLLFLLFAFLIVRLVRHATTGLTMPEALMAFGFKALMACAYGYLFMHYYGGDDTWKYNQLSLHEYKLLMEHPGEFFWELTPATAWRNSGGHIWQAFSLYLVDLEYCMIAKTLGIFNIISRGNYYANAIFFSFLTFWGHYWLFQLLAGIFPQKRKLLIAAIFFFPPVVFWLSGIRADGLILVFLSLSLLHAWKWIERHRKTAILHMLLGLAGIFILRNEIILLLAPALISWLIIVRFNRKPIHVLSIVYGIAVIVFFGSTRLSGVPNLPAMIVVRQEEFMALKGNTRFQLDTLQPTIGSFLQVLPQAISNTFLRPYIWEAHGILQIMTALEIMFLWALILCAIVRRDKSIKYRTHPLLLIMLIFSVSLYLFIGYITPFPGAIVRYKIIPELFLLTILCISTSTPKRYFKPLTQNS